MHAVKLIARTNVDWDSFLSIAHQATGERLAQEADESRREFTPEEKLASCLARLVNSSSPDFDHSHLSILLGVDERDSDNLMSQLAPLTTLVRPTLQRVSIIVATGSVQQWLTVSQGKTGDIWNDIRGLIPVEGRIKRLN